MQHQYPHASFSLWGRSLEKAKIIAKDIDMCNSIQELIAQSDVVITTTASHQPIIHAHDVVGKKHIIALGSDDVHKQECDPQLLGRADVVITDSRAQAAQYGEIFHAISSKMLALNSVLELGATLEAPLSSDTKLVVTDLTGIAAQDVAIVRTLMTTLMRV